MNTLDKPATKPSINSNEKSHSNSLLIIVSNKLESITGALMILFKRNEARKKEKRSLIISATAPTQHVLQRP
jgi:hypothetical protein